MFDAGAVQRSCAQQIAKVFDQYLAYISLESNMFSLGLPNIYLELNNPTAKDHEIQVGLTPILPLDAHVSIDSSQFMRWCYLHIQTVFDPSGNNAV